MVERRLPVATHWGSFVAVVDSGQLVRIEPRGDDPAPSPIGPGMVTAVDDSARVLRPAVRKGWLDGLPRAHDTARGADAFVEVSWDDAITVAMPVHGGAVERSRGSECERGLEVGERRRSR
ncbi:hypothetical protein [Streptomyces sp. NPDC059894]|uniref:hypothetical protein n=1 Tax=unclassified Streptomyces TaxID=2593676 RepID=UPI00366738C7